MGACAVVTDLGGVMLQRMVEIVPPLHIEDGYLSPCFLVQIGSHSQIEGFLTKQKAITLLAIVQTGDWLSSNRPESRIPNIPAAGYYGGASVPEDGSV